jgi:hypothetical protein
MSAACVFAPTSQRQGARAFGLNRPPHSAQVAVRAAAPGCPAFSPGCRSGEAISGEAVSWCPAASSVAGAPRHQIGHFEIIGRNGVKADIDGPDDRKPSYSGRGRSLAGTAGYSQMQTWPLSLAGSPANLACVRYSLRSSPLMRALEVSDGTARLVGPVTDEKPPCHPARHPRGSSRRCRQSAGAPWAMNLGGGTGGIRRSTAVPRRRTNSSP